MNKRSIIALALLASLSTTTYALEKPTSSKADTRIQYVDFKDNDVVRLNAANGCISTIVFSSGEEVQNYGSGYSTAWEFAAAGNNFFLKPKAIDGTTNLVIVTNKHIYNFDVHLMPKAQDATYRLTFTYSNEAKKKLKAKLVKDELDKALNQKDPDAYESFPEGNYHYTQNFGYSANSKIIAPIEVHDNGRFTYFKFRNNQDFPAIYQVTTDGESMLNYHVENGVMVVHGVYPEYRLRAGTDVVGVYNEAYEAYLDNINTAPMSPTSVKGIVREYR